MSEKNEVKYISFELCLVKNINKDLVDIFNYGIAKFSLKYEIDQDRVIGTLVDIFNKMQLPTDIHGEYYDNVFDQWGDWDIVNCDNDEQIDLVEEEYNKGKINNGYNYADLFCKIENACDFLGLKRGNEHKIISSYNNIKNKVEAFESQHNKDAAVMMSIDMLLNYSNYDKTCREWELLRAFLSIKSIIGNKEFCATNKAMIIQRMIGAKSNEVLKEFSKDALIKKLYAKYSGRYFFDQLIFELRANNFIKSKITYGRALYISCKKDMDEMVKCIAENQQKRQQKTSVSIFKEEEKQKQKELANLLKNK